MKKFYISMMLLGLALTSYGSIKGYKSMVLNHNDGKTTVVSLEDGMSTSVSGGNLSLSSARGSVTVPTNELRTWNYSADGVTDDQNGWQGLELTDADAVGIVIGTDGISLYNLSVGSRILMVGIDGRVVVSTTSAGGSLEIPTSDFQSGVYVLKINDKSFKIAVR